MILVRSSVARLLLALLVVLVSCICPFAGAQSPAQSELVPATPASAPSTAPPAAPPEIHVNQRCRQLTPATVRVAAKPGHGFPAQMFCRLESVNTTQHPEKTIVNGKPHRILVTVAEQDYLLQNITGAPVVFVVEHYVPKGWQVDSDPQPETLVGSRAIFHVNAQPGQTVRLHVGLRTTNLPPFIPPAPIVLGAPDIHTMP